MDSGSEREDIDLAEKIFGSAKYIWNQIVNQKKM